MTETAGWVLAAVAALLVAAARVLKAGVNPPKMPLPPPMAPGASHAREAIEDAARRNVDEINDAETGADPAGQLADLANRAQRRRTQ